MIIMPSIENKKKRLISLRFKTVAMILVIAIVLSVVAVTISYQRYSSAMDKHYKTLASNLATTAVTQLDADALLYYYNEVKKIGAFDNDRYVSDVTYQAEFDVKAESLKDDKYYEMLDTLFDIKESNDILYLYVQKLDAGGTTVTYLLDADDDGEQLGVVHPISVELEGNNSIEDGIPAFITEYEDDGWLVSTIVPVKDSDGNSVALVGVDISMDEIMHDRSFYLRNVVIYMIIAVALICALILPTVNAKMVKPINTLSHATGSFVENRSNGKQEDSALSKLNLKTGDEIENLCDSVKQMERDINDYIDNLTAVTAEKERIGAELELAKRIQADMLPNVFPPFPDRADFEIYASMTPAKEVGGDFYDFFLVDDKHLAMVMADVSGKGVPAALFMMMSKILIQNAANSGLSPADALETVNNQICANNREEMFVTVWLGIIDLDSGLLRAANAGHEKPIIMNAGGDFETYMDRHGFVIGGMSGLKYKNYEIQLEKGSKLFIYTDGVAEATDKNEKLFGLERTVDALNEAKSENPMFIIENVKKRVDEFVGEAPQFDDLTMLCFEYIGSDSKVIDADNEITVDATLENVSQTVDFVCEKAEALPFSTKDRYQIDVAVDEIVSNVARYAYIGTTGKVTVKAETGDNSLTITVIDSGRPYNPLEKEDPDVTLPAEARGVGGYGIYIVKKVMDEITYEYKDGHNILKMTKKC